MRLLREDGTPQLALKQFANYTPPLGICQWFHFEDPRLDDGVRWLKDLGVKYVRTGLSWALWRLARPQCSTTLEPRPGRAAELQLNDWPGGSHPGPHERRLTTQRSSAEH